MLTNLQTFLLIISVINKMKYTDTIRTAAVIKALACFENKQTQISKDAVTLLTRNKSTPP